MTGYAGCVPVGGVAWDYLQYAVGLAKLGHDVYYHEDTFKWPYHPVQASQVADGTYSARYIHNFFKQFAPDLCERWHYFHLREKSFGMSREAFAEIARTADLFLNISGASSTPGELSSSCRKVFIDTDPGYNQIHMLQKREQTGKMPGLLRSHDLYFTYAENIHSLDCLLPQLDVEWKTTRMPIVLDLWSKISTKTPIQNASWSSVMTWNDFKDALIYQGKNYGSKTQEFEKIMELPKHSSLSFLIALGGDPPLARLTENGWKVADGPLVTRTPQKYREFIATSRGEISIAKNVYVALRTGWFSCRSACYLAAGRPVVIQNTGFDAVLPTGQGILGFHDLEEAIQALNEIESNYKTHADAAKRIAGDYFDSSKVLNQLIVDALG